MATITKPRRTFEDKPATREQTPLLVGLVGPSGSGKTFSALRLASGIQKVSGGDVFMIDTEARRGLAYADNFRFRHVPFAAPFGPLDYLSAIEYAASKGARTIIVDNMSHEHEGPGGVLEMHAAEVERMSGGDSRKAFKVQMLAWQQPKAERRRLLNTLLQIPVNFIFCFRAKEKLKIAPGKDPVPLGFQPIAGEEFVYEMSLNCLLYPGSKGVPTWTPDEQGERVMIKLPLQFEGIFAERGPLSEATGEKLARWAAGSGQTLASIEDRRASAIKAFAARGVTPGQVAWLAGADSPDLITGDQLESLRGHLASLKGGKTTVADLFKHESQEPPVAAEDQSQANDDDLHDLESREAGTGG